MKETKYKQRADNKLLMEIEEKKAQRIVEEELPKLKPSEPMSEQEWNDVLARIQKWKESPEIKNLPPRKVFKPIVVKRRE